MTTHDNETDEERTARNGQLTKADLSRMFAAKQYGAIAEARAAGRINVLMGGEAPLDLDKPITSADVKTLFAQKKYAAIEQLRRDGKLNALLSAPNPEGN